MSVRNISCGDKFGQLIVVKAYCEKNPSGKWKHLCECECGNKKTIVGNHLKGGKILSCGCYIAKITSERMTKHGKHGSQTYSIWKGMRKRCNNPNEPAYPRYGGAGIKVCDRWSNYELFLEDMGERPEGLTIDRIDGAKGYYNENCRWATYTEQARNRSCKNKTNHVGIRILPSGRYAAQICADYKHMYLGSFDEIEEAIKARKQAEEKYW